MNYKSCLMRNLNTMLLMQMLSVNALAHVYVAPVDTAQWSVETSPLYCRLWQKVPAYGRGIFENEAGLRQNFQLESKKKVFDEGQAKISSVSPAWKFNIPDQAIGQQMTQKGLKPLQVEETLTSFLLDELEAGQFVQIVHPGWHQDHKVTIQVSSVNFTEAYREYLTCLGYLYPANFKQLEKTTILFDTDKYDIRKEYFERLELIKGYLDVDPDVEQLVIDGHTDNRGTHGYNFELSRNRADAIAAYLSTIGVPKEKIILRYHGEIFPVVTNKTSFERQRNRRTTIRLVKKNN